MTVEQAINSMDAQVGHADVVRVGVNEGDGDSTSPVFDNGARFAGKTIPSFFDFVIAHLVHYII